MGALDQTLMLAGATQAAPPAAGTGVSSNPMGATPPTPSAPVSGAGALHQAMGIQKAASTAVATDPMAAMAQDAIASDQREKEKAAAKIEANAAQAAALEAQPDDPRPSVPRLAPLNPAPGLHPSDPMRVFGQVLPVLAALGALTTRTPAVNALNAATAMMNAARDRDKTEEERQRQLWLDNTKATVDNNNTLMTSYKLALDDHNLSMAEKQAKIAAIAAANKDTLTIATLRSGKMDSLTNYINVMQKAQEQLAGLTEHIISADAERQRQDDQRLYQWAQLEMDRRKQERPPMGDAIGPILAKVAASNLAPGQDLTSVLSPGERMALAAYQRINSNGGYVDNPSEPPTQGGLLPGGAGAPAAAPAVTSAPPHGTLTAVPQDRKAWVKDTWYATPKGPAHYLGNDQWALPGG